MTDQNVPEWEKQLRDEWPLAESTAITAGDWVRLENFIRTQIEKAEARGAERAVKYISYELDAAENDKEMADDPQDPKVRINYFRHILEAAKNITTDV